MSFNQRINLRILVKSIVILTTMMITLVLTTPSYTNIGFAFSPPPNGKIVSMVNPDGVSNIDDFEIYIINTDSSNQMQLTENATFDGYPTWSPNGKKIAFSSTRDGNWEIYVMDADGSNQTNITNTPYIDEIFPTWSPNGKQLAVTADKNGNFNFNAATWADADIFVMDADGSNSVNITDDDTEDYGAVWSPNGKKIAFSTIRDGNNEIYVMNADGSNPTNLTNNNASDGFWAPSWSPNGKKIAFITNRDGGDLFGGAEVYVMDADGSNPTRLTNNDVIDAAPIWSQNGQSIIFRSNRDNDTEIYLMNADGSDQMQITTGIEVWLIFDWASGNVN